MKAYVVTEGDFERDMLQTVLPRNLAEEVGIVSGRSGHISLARTLILRRKVPVVLVQNADCFSEKLIAEQRQEAEELLRMVAGATPYKVVFFIPEMEAIFFEDTSLLPRLLGHELPQDILDMAKIRPRKALNDALAQSRFAQNTRISLLQAFSEKDVTVLQESQAIQEIMRFLRDTRKEKQAA